MWVSTNSCAEPYAYHSRDSGDNEQGESEPVNVISISQNTPLWYFGTGAPASDFTLGSTSATLTANGVSSGTFHWTVTTGTTKVAFANNGTTITNTDSNTVTIHSTSYSTDANDVTVQLQYTAPDELISHTLNWTLQVDSPYKLVSNGSTSNYATQTACSDTTGSNGYQSQVLPYLIVSFFGQTMAHTNFNEYLGGSRFDYYSGK